MTATPADLAATYFEAWTARDFDRLRTVLDDAVTFRGPLGQADGADECLAGLRGMAEGTDGVEVVKRWADDTDAITWFDLRMKGADPVPTANWSHVENGRITAIRAAFDPRPITGG